MRPNAKTANLNKKSSWERNEMERDRGRVLEERNWNTERQRMWLE